MSSRACLDLLFSMSKRSIEHKKRNVNRSCSVWQGFSVCAYVREATFSLGQAQFQLGGGVGQLLLQLEDLILLTFAAPLCLL